MSASQKFQHRADVDGLRAIAVIMVVFFHANCPGLQGGFVGVDVFFVISGFLITSLIVADLEEGSFSLASFYERRARRIVPALATVIALSLLAGAILIPPHAYRNLAKYAESAAGFTLNGLAANDAGYFAMDTGFKPLIHLWSLAVEEQFYVFYPLLLIACWRFRPRAWPVAVAGLALASLAACAHAKAGPGLFYSASMRFWELGLGCLLASPQLSGPQRPWQRDGLALLGLGLVFGGACFYSAETPYPGLATLAPTLGASALILAGKRGLGHVGRALGLKPMAFMGALSYSLYLWHWPILVFTKIWCIEPLDQAQIGAFLALSFLAAWLSWRWIERPFRNSRSSPFQAWPLVAALLCLGSLAWIGHWIGHNNGFFGRYSGGVSEDPLQDSHEKLLVEGPFSSVADYLQPLGLAAGQPHFLVWGDSHSMALKPAFDLDAKNRKICGALARMPGVAPLLGAAEADAPQYRQFNDAVLAYIAGHKELKTVILAARWDFQPEGPGHRWDLHRELLDASSGGLKGNDAIFKRGFSSTLRRLLALGRRVIVVTQVPPLRLDPMQFSMVAARRGLDLDQAFGMSQVDYAQHLRLFNEAIADWRGVKGITVFDLGGKMFSGGRFAVQKDGVLLYKDSTHLSYPGALRVAPLLDGVFDLLSP